MLRTRLPHPLFLCIAALLLISVIPTVVALIVQPPGWKWTGILSRNTADVNGYLSIIEESRQGNFFTHNLFTAEPHPAFQIRPYYTLLGLIGRLFPALSNVFLLEAGRLIAAFIFLMLLQALVRRIFAATSEQVIAFLIAATASGLGWMHLTADPPDLRIVETSTFLGLNSPPLYCVSLSLFLGMLLCLHAAWNSTSRAMQWRYGLLAALFAFWEGLDRPFLLAPLLASVAAALVWFGVLRHRLETFLIPVVLIFSGALLAISYQAHLVSKIPVYAEWNRQHYLLTPNLLRFLLSYGLLLPLAILGIRPLYKRNSEMAVLLTSFLLFSWFLSRLPIQFQERFLEGSHLCLAILAASGLLRLLQPLPSVKLRHLYAAMAICLLIPSSLIALSHDIRIVQTKQPPQYLPAELIAGMQQLRALVKPGEAILSAQSSGNFIPAYSGRQVVVGHQIQTANFFEKLSMDTEFFHTGAHDPYSPVLMVSARATWLFWGPEERWLATNKFDPEKSPYLERMYSNRLVRIYRLRSWQLGG